MEITFLREYHLHGNELIYIPVVTTRSSVQSSLVRRYLTGPDMCRSIGWITVDLVLEIL